ncbi:MAG: 3-oxoacyl-ACP reductase [Chloroflexi bacterium]|nr:3-oxoacyl-ACP reductase [Chloroflexota bacterium]|tara:strand:+ start:4049 stop:4816 length:768 start_codon:yes stop_codon:yes gene_type:complete
MTKDNGKVAIVTGGGSGIGKASAIALLNDGYSVVISGRREDPLKKTIEECGEMDNHEKILGITCDVGDPNSVKNLFKSTIEEFGRLDVLFNNAGGGAPKKLIEDLTYEEWQNVVDANLTGTFLCSQEAINIMKSQNPMGGRIINNGSISAYAPRPDSAPYTATKHGVSGLTKSISLDGRKYNIACSQIDIGNAATDMTERMKNGVPQANGSTMVEPTFDVNHVAEVVVNISNFPLETNVQFITIMATKMPFIGRG